MEDGDTEIESRGNDNGPSSGEGLRGVGGSGSDTDCDGDCEVAGSTDDSRDSCNSDKGVKDSSRMVMVSRTQDICG